MTIHQSIESRLPFDAEATVAERTRNRLLRAGIDSFAELGFHAASTRLVEGAAGVKRNLITHHWGSKEAFWKACFDTLAAAFGRELLLAEAQAVNVDGVERLRFFVRAFVRASAKYPEVQRIMLDEGKRDEDRLRWIVQRHVQPLKAWLEGLLDEARRQGAAPNLDLVGFYYALVGATGMFAMAPECRLLFDRDPFEDTAVAAHADAVSRLLIPDPRASTREMA